MSQLPPGSDDDLPSPSPTQHYYKPDSLGWTRTPLSVKVEEFCGAKPAGPTFAKLNSPVDYFLQFFPITIIMAVVTFTNLTLVAAGEHLTNLQEMEVLFSLPSSDGTHQSTLHQRLLVIRSRPQEPLCGHDHVKEAVWRSDAGTYLCWSSWAGGTKEEERRGEDQEQEAQRAAKHHSLSCQACLGFSPGSMQD